MPYTQLARLGRTFSVAGNTPYVGGVREEVGDGAPRSGDPFVCRACGDGSVAAGVCTRCGVGLVPADDRPAPMLVARPGENPRGTGRGSADRAKFAGMFGGFGAFVGLSLWVWNNHSAIGAIPNGTMIGAMAVLVAAGLAAVASPAVYFGTRTLVRRRRFAEAARLADEARAQAPLTRIAEVQPGLVRVRGRVRAGDPGRPVATVEADGTRTSQPFSLADASGEVRIADAALELWDAAGSARVEIRDGDEIEIVGTVVERHEPGPASDRDGYRERRAVRVLARRDDVPLHLFLLQRAAAHVPRMRVEAEPAPQAEEQPDEITDSARGDKLRSPRSTLP